MEASERDFQLLRLLADGRFQSGETLAQRMGISRTGVWKQLRRCRDSLGLEVDAVRGRGYRLRRPLELLDGERILHHLPENTRQRVGMPVIHASVDSTNTWLMNRARLGAPGGAVCLAEHQTAGRGRHGRHWVSPFGSNIYLSLLWRYSLPPSGLAGLSLVCGVAVIRALIRLGVTGAALKWPNDILWERRKLAGLLLEVGGEASGPSFVVTGIGINTHLDRRHAGAIDQPWTDLNSVPGVDPKPRNHIASTLVAELVRAMEQFGHAGLRPFVSDWRRHDHFRGEQVVLNIGPRQVTGYYLGIAEDGSLCLAVNGETVQYNVGEVTLCRAGT